MSKMIIVTNESSGKAFRKSALVLDMFLNRIAPRCWHGNLSSEGYEEMVSEVKVAANKNTCVQFFWAHLHDCRLMDVVGHDPARGKAWSPVGIQLKKQFARQFKPFEQLTRLLAMLAAYLHDTGKAKKDTQGVYRGADRQTEQLYHEVASAFWFERYFTESAGSYRFAVGGNAEWKKLGVWPEDSLKRVIFQSILSHHGLPESTGSGSDVHYKISRIRGSEAAGSFSLLLKHSDGKPVFTDQLVSSIDLVLNTELKASHLKLLEGKVDFDGWGMVATAEEYFFFVHRLLLMIGDATESAFESSEKYQKAKHNGRVIFEDSKILPLDEGVVYAKSARHVRLDRHLIGAADFARKAAYLLYQRQAPRIDRKPKIFNQMAEKGSPYYWQNAACAGIQSYQNKQEEGFSFSEQGFFGVVTSNTGTGKTQGCYLLMSALSEGKPRYTLGLGYGVLAVQGGVEYWSEIGLTDKECATAVGSRFKQYLCESLKKAEATGADNSAAARLEEISKLESSLSGGSTSSHTTDIHDLLLAGDKGMSGKLLDTPIVVMTIDHIAAAMNPDRGSFIGAMLRIATADLLIDEIDSFSEQDMHGVARLVYFSGLFGRKVLVSSATLPAELAEGLLAMYAKGYKAYQEASGSADFHVGLINDAKATAYVKITSFDEMASKSAFCNFYHEFHKKVTQSPTKRTSVKAEPAFKDQSGSIVKPSDWPGLCRAIVRECVSMANRNHESFSGYTVSVGAVRLGSVKNVQKSAMQMAELIRSKDDCLEGWTVKIQPLHGRLDAKVREKVQSGISYLVGKEPRREPSKLWSHFTHEHQALLDESDQGAKKTLIIVIATSVIEVGVDYDFDWLLTEPSTSSAMIQLAGRLLRHRWLHRSGVDNFRMMPFTVPEMISQKSGMDRYGGNYHTGSIAPILDSTILDLEVKARPRKGFGAIKKSATADPATLLSEQSTLDSFLGKEGVQFLTNSTRLAPPVTLVDQVERLKIQSIFGTNQERPKQLGHFLQEGSPFCTNEYLLEFREDKGVSEKFCRVMQEEGKLLLQFDQGELTVAIVWLDLDDVLFMPATKLPSVKLGHELSLLMHSTNAETIYKYHSSIGLIW